MEHWINKWLQTGIQYERVHVNECILVKCQSMQYLGVILDKKISWIEHISHVKNKVAKGIGIMYKAIQYLDQKSLVNLHHSYFPLFYLYCIESWGNAPHCHLYPLYILQKRVIRIMTFSKFDVSSDYLFRNLNILPLDKLVFHIIGLMMHKYANGALPPVMSDLYTLNII